jgi:hypothetical protein
VKSMNTKPQTALSNVSILPFLGVASATFGIPLIRLKPIKGPLFGGLTYRTFLGLDGLGSRENGLVLRQILVAPTSPAGAAGEFSLYFSIFLYRVEESIPRMEAALLFCHPV